MTTEPAAAPRTMLQTIDRVLYPATLGTTAVIVAMEVYEFWQGGFFKARYPYAQVYLAVLTAYAAQREISKWHGDDPGLRLRRGELFVGLWIAAWLAITTIANLSPRFTVPTELNTITLGVLAVFAGTGVSSILRHRAGSARMTDEEAMAENPSTRGSQIAADRRVKIIRHLNEKGPSTAGEVAEALSVSTTTAWRDLELLEKEGRVVQDDSTDPRSRKYRLTS